MRAAMNGNGIVAAISAPASSANTVSGIFMRYAGVDDGIHLLHLGTRSRNLKRTRRGGMARCSPRRDALPIVFIRLSACAQAEMPAMA